MFCGHPVKIDIYIDICRPVISSAQKSASRKGFWRGEGREKELGQGEYLFWGGNYIILFPLLGKCNTQLFFLYIFVTLHYINVTLKKKLNAIRYLVFFFAFLIQVIISIIHFNQSINHQGLFFCGFPKAASI